MRAAAHRPWRWHWKYIKKTENGLNSLITFYDKKEFQCEQWMNWVAKVEWMSWLALAFILLCPTFDLMSQVAFTQCLRKKHSEIESFPNVTLDEAVAGMFWDRHTSLWFGHFICDVYHVWNEKNKRRIEAENGGGKKRSCDRWKWWWHKRAHGPNETNTRKWKWNKRYWEWCVTNGRREKWFLKMTWNAQQNEALKAMLMHSVLMWLKNGIGLLRYISRD